MVLLMCLAVCSRFSLFSSILGYGIIFGMRQGLTSFLILVLGSGSLLKMDASSRTGYT